MANQVNSKLYIGRINAKAYEKVKKMFKYDEANQSTKVKNFHDIMTDSPDQPDYNWYMDHVGPKWCHFENYYFDQCDVSLSREAMIQCKSAERWPDKAYHWLVNELRKEDPYLLARCTYEGKAPNFYGVAGWGPAGFENYYMDKDIGIDQDILWDTHCKRNVELYDDDGEQVEYHADGTPKKEVKPTWQDQ